VQIANSESDVLEILIFFVIINGDLPSIQELHKKIMAWSFSFHENNPIKLATFAQACFHSFILTHGYMCSNSIVYFCNASANQYLSSSFRNMGLDIFSFCLLIACELDGIC
jgi:hypothetical protein